MTQNRRPDIPASIWTRRKRFQAMAFIRHTDTPRHMCAGIAVQIRAGLEDEKSPGQPGTSTSNLPRRKGTGSQICLVSWEGPLREILWTTRCLDFLFFCMTGMAFAYSCLGRFVRQERSLFPWQASTRWKADGGRAEQRCLLCATSSDTGHPPCCFGF